MLEKMNYVNGQEVYTYANGEFIRNPDNYGK